MLHSLGILLTDYAIPATAITEFELGMTRKFSDTGLRLTTKGAEKTFELNRTKAPSSHVTMVVDQCSTNMAPLSWTVSEGMCLWIEIDNAHR